MKRTLQDRNLLLSLLLVGLDIILFFALIGAEIWLFDENNLIVLFALILQFPILLLCGGYRSHKNWDFTAIQVLLTRSLAIDVLFLIFAYPLSLVLTPAKSADFDWGMILLNVLAFLTLSGLLRIAYHSAIRFLYQKKIFSIDLALIGTQPEIALFQKRVSANPWLGIHFPTIIDLDKFPGVDAAPVREQLGSRSLQGIWVVYHPATAREEHKLLLQTLSETVRMPWYFLPQDYEGFSKGILTRLTFHQMKDFMMHLQPQLDLPIHRVAMLGSRGIPANYSGIETYVEEVSRYLVEMGNQVTVYCHRKYVSERGIYQGVHLRFLPTVPSKHLETFVHTLLASIDVLFREIEIVHYHAQGPATFAWIPRIFGRKVISCVQGLDWARAKWGRAARLYLQMGEIASVWFPHETVVVSRVLADHYRQKYDKPVTVLPNGFTPPKPLPPDEIRQFGLQKGNYYLFVGRLVPEKGIHTLIEAFRKTTSQRYLVIAGRATFADEYQQRLRQLAGDDPRVVFTGFLSGAPLQELFTNPYAIIHPSDLEGLSIALLEGFSYGNCILTSDRPENIEAVDGVGITFETGSVDDLQVKIQHLDDNPEAVLAARQAVQAKLAEKLDWQGVARQNNLIYDRVSGK